MDILEKKQILKIYEICNFKKLFKIGEQFNITIEIKKYY